MPTSGEEPCSTACPWTAAASTAGSQSAPPSTRTVPETGSAITVFIAPVRTTTTSSRPCAASGPALWPVLCGATRRPISAATRTTAPTSAAVWGTATAAGPLVDGDVPGQSRGVVPGVPGQVDASGRQAAEGGGGPVGAERVGRGGRRGQVDGHEVTPLSVVVFSVGPRCARPLGIDFGTTWSGGPDRHGPTGWCGPGPIPRRVQIRERPRRGSLCCGRGGRSPRPGRGEAGRAHGRPRHAQAAGAGRRAGALRRPSGLGRHDRRPALGRRARRRGSAGRCRSTSPACAGCSSPTGSAAPPATVLVTVEPGYALRVARRRASTPGASSRAVARPATRRCRAARPDRPARGSGATCSTDGGRRTSTRRSPSGAARRTSSSRTRRRGRRAGPAGGAPRWWRWRTAPSPTLALGHHATVAAELEALTARHPLRERLWAPAGARPGPVRSPGRRARGAAPRCGRCSTRSSGLEPGAELRELQTAVLRQDPALDWVAAAPAATWSRSRRPDARPGAAPGRRSRLPPWPMVGRDRQLEALLERARPAASGRRRRSPSLTGRAGHRQVPAEPRSSPRVAWRAGAGCWSVAAPRTTARPPLWPWQQVLERLGEAARAREARRTRAREFRVRERLARRSPTPPRPSPCCVVLDDLHWADVATPPGAAAARRDRHRPAGCWSSSTWRAHPEPTGALADVAESLARRHADRLELTGLAPGDGRRGGRARWPARSPDDDQASALAERTDGNPFFLVEYARLAGERRRPRRAWSPRTHPPDRGAPTCSPGGCEQLPDDTVTHCCGRPR